MRRLASWLLVTTALLGMATPAAAGAVVVYSTDFNAGGLPAGFSGAGVITSVQNYAGVGDFSGNFLRNASAGNPQPLTSLTLTGLPDHTHVSLDFLLAVIDSWDGSTTAGGTAPPDFFNVRVNGALVFSHSFDNFIKGDGTYPGAALTFGANRFHAGGTVWPDSAYDMGVEAAFQNIAHTSSTLVVDWFVTGGGWQGGTDESWAIDNLTVSVIPEPETFGLLLAALALLTLTGRRKRPKVLA